MKLRLAFITIYSLFLIPSGFAAEGHQLVDRVAAVVNDEIITQSEVDMVFYPIYEQVRKEFEGRANMERELQKARLKLINQLIEDKLVYQQAKKLGLEVSDDEIKDEMDNFKAQFKTPEEFQQEIDKSGMKVADFEAKIRERLAIMKLHQYEIHGKITVSETEISEFYKAHAKEFTQSERVKLWTITTKKNEEAASKGLTDEKARQKIEGILKRLKENENFEEVARKESEGPQAAEGGFLGVIEKGDMVGHIDQVIFSLAEGSISEILETPDGYHIFKVGEKQAASEKTFEQAKDEIREQLFRQKAHKRFVKWMDDLKKSAYISIR